MYRAKKDGKETSNKGMRIRADDDLRTSFTWMETSLGPLNRLQGDQVAIRRNWNDWNLQNVVQSDDVHRGLELYQNEPR